MNWTKTPDGFSKIVTGPALDNLATYAILERMKGWPWKVSVESGPIFGTARRFYFGQDLKAESAESAQEEAIGVLAARGWN